MLKTIPVPIRGLPGKENAYHQLLARPEARRQVHREQTDLFQNVPDTDIVQDHSVFSKNRDLLLEGDILAEFLSAILSQLKVKRLLFPDHFSVDDTLVEAWASIRSVKPKDGPTDGPKDGSGAPPTGGGGRNAQADFHGEKRTNETHASATDPDYTGKARARRRRSASGGTA